MYIVMFVSPSMGSFGIQHWPYAKPQSNLEPCCQLLCPPIVRFRLAFDEEMNRKIGFSEERRQIQKERRMKEALR
jgi:hypothetical protein